MNRYVEISFDCLPLRSVGRLDIPMDASPKYRERCERINAPLKTMARTTPTFSITPSAATA